jgi:glycosyl transferase family 25
MNSTDEANFHVMVRIINSPAQVDRRKLASERFANFPIKWEFFDVVPHDGDSIIEYSPKKNIFKFWRPLRPAEISCFKSHVGAISQFLNCPDSQYLIIFEDDVLPDHKFNYMELLKYMTPHKIQFMKLYFRFLNNSRRVGFFDHREIRFSTTDASGTQAYVLSRLGAEKFIGSVKEIVRPFDDEIARAWAIGLPGYAIFPFPVIEMEAKSTIQVADSTLKGHDPKDMQMLAMRLAYKSVQKIRKILFNVNQQFMSLNIGHRSD